MKRLLKRISDNLEISLPATPAAIEKAETHFNFQFPEDYKEFLRFSNGLEGEIAGNYLVLWSIEEVVELNQAYHVKEFVANIIIFGSDGGEEAFAFDSSTTGKNIINLPFIGMGHVANETISDSFEHFLESRIKENNNFFKRLFR